jgi:glycosyltransferase involved in cell wall biosynthesis
MSTHFRGKNGPVVVEAFHKVRDRVPGARLAVVGHMPPARERSSTVEWVGFLDPGDPAQDLRKRTLFSEAACIVHPTNFDTNPAVLVEAAYFGCPAISTDAFAIPEIVQHDETGYLVSDPYDVDKIAGHMLWMLEAPDAYWAMRRAARDHALSQMTSDRFQADIVEIVLENLPECRLS